jgi:hypothetical protein
MARKLEIEIIGDSRSYERALGRASQQSASFGSSLGKMAKMAGLAAGAAGVGALIVTLKTGFEEIMEGQKVLAQTNAVLKSTGGIANVTAKHVESLARSQSRLTGIDDELIQTGENLLLTFKNVRNEVGQGNAVFDRATKSALDLSTAGFGSVESAAKMMGKALNDPIKGMTALGRAGVTFSEEQKEAIKALVETGDELGAQKLILAEVESQVGGSARAFGETLPGQIAKAKNAFAEVSGELAVSLLPAVTKTLDGFNRFLVFVQENMPKWKAAVVENTRPVVEVLTKVWNWIQANLIPIFRQMAQVALEQWAKIAQVFQKHGPEIQRIIERVTAAVEPLIKAWLFLAQNVVIPIIKPLFTVVIPAALLATVVVLDKVTFAVESVISVFKWLGSKTGGIFKGMLQAVTGPLEAAISLFQRLYDIVARVKAIIQGALDALANIKLPKLPGIPGFAGGVKNFKGGFAVVGEKGPELVRLPRGSDVLPATTNTRSSGGGGTGGGDINVYLPNYLGSPSEVAQVIRDELIKLGRRNGGNILGGYA